MKLYKIIYVQSDLPVAADDSNFGAYNNVL